MERKEMNNQVSVNPEFDELEQRLNEVIAQYEQLKLDYAQLKEDSNRYIQLWLDTKPHKPLTAERINEIQKRVIEQWHAKDELHVEYARAIEAAHGIGSGE